MSGPTTELTERIRDSSRRIATPHQVALGLALGMLVGLIPKFSLLVVLFGLLLILSNADLLAGILSALVFTGLSIFMDDVAHEIGWFFLSLAPIQTACEASLAIPLFAWLRLENTVVFGNFALGIALVTPLYMAGFQSHKKYREPINRWITRIRLSRRNLGHASNEIHETQ
jgi:uncharacterized protein (TIGR03546 family)